MLGSPVTLTISSIFDQLESSLGTSHVFFDAHRSVLCLSFLGSERLLGGEIQVPKSAEACGVATGPPN